MLLTLTVRSKQYNFDGEFKHKLNIIQGDSATGKSTLYKAVTNTSGAYTTVAMGNKKKLEIVTGLNAGTFELIIGSKQGALIVIDEPGYTHTKQFARVLSSDAANWFIIISRKPFVSVGYSVESVYCMASDKAARKWFTKPELTAKARIPKNFNRVICEDSGSGFEFYGKIIPGTESAGGKDNVEKQIRKDEKTLLLVDAGGFGACARRIKHTMSTIYMYTDLLCFERVLCWRKQWI
jgi:hypothetical protein